MTTAEPKLQSKANPQQLEANSLKAIPVIVWSNTSHDLQLEICRELGANVVLRKSRNGRELKTAVQNLQRA
jgi:CheY-like chemotaxis protein